MIINVFALGKTVGFHSSFGGVSPAQIALEQPTFLVPDGRTFALWSFIYFFQGLFSIYQVIPCFQNSHAAVTTARFWVVLLFTTNCLFLVVFCRRVYWLSSLLIVVQDIALVQIYRMMKINYGSIDRYQTADMMIPTYWVEECSQTTARLGGSDKLPSECKLLHPWYLKVFFIGFSGNISWLALTTLANLTISIGSEGWRQSNAVTIPSGGNVTTLYVNGSEGFSIAGLCFAAGVACVLAVRNCDVPYALGLVWALLGVYRAQTSHPYAGAFISKAVADWTLALAITVAVAALVGLIKAVIETFRAKILLRGSEEGAEQSDRYFLVSCGDADVGMAEGQ